MKYRDWKFVSFAQSHSNFHDPYDIFTREQDDEGNPIPINDDLWRMMEYGRAFVLSCYQHSGIAWSLINEGTQCQFDTARVAGLVVFQGMAKDLPKGVEARKEYVREVLNGYNDYLNGYEDQYYEVLEELTK